MSEPEWLDIDIILDVHAEQLALFGGAEHIERVDCLVRRIAGQQGLQSDTLDEIVTLVDERLKKNRGKFGNSTSDA